MGYIEGTPREQAMLFPERVDDYVEGGNPVRFIDAYVEQLDLDELGFARCRPAQALHLRVQQPHPIDTGVGAGVRP